MSLGAGSGPQLMDLDVFPRDAVTAESLAALLTTKRGTVTTEARRQRWRWWRWWWRRERVAVKAEVERAACAGREEGRTFGSDGSSRRGTRR